MANNDEARVVSASRKISAPPERIFELIADPAQQPRWDGNDNLAHADEGQRVWAVGDVFIMTNVSGNVRQNHVIEFAEGSLIAWRTTANPGEAPLGQVWRWVLEPSGDGGVLVTHTYDWTAVHDNPKAEGRARQTTADRLRASLDRLAAVAEDR